jgi:intein/homing endonuclease
MPIEEFKELKQRSLFSKLRRLFSTDVIVRNIGGKKLKVIDTEELAYATDRNTLRDRFNRIRTSAYNQYSRDFTLSYQAARIELFRDYDCVGPDTVIPLPDGSRPTIAELTEKYKDKPQERFYVFSYDHETNSIKLGKAYHPRKKEGGQRDCWKIILDNDQYVIGSAGHPFLMRNGEYKTIEELRVGDSLMPFYQKDFYGRGYRHIFNFNKKWQTEHRIITEQFYRCPNKDEVIHHKNFNAGDNSPDNLQIMNATEHKEFHSNHSKNVIWGKSNYENQLNKLKSHPNYINRNFHHWNGERAGTNNPFYGKSHTKESNEQRSSTLKEVFENRNQTGENNPKYRDDLTIEVLTIKALEYYKEHGKLTSWEFVKSLGCDYSVLQNRLKHNNTNWKSFKNSIENKLNHKIKRIEFIGKLDVYDVTVEKYQNFATGAGIFCHNTMDMDPIISSALDIYADECLTQNEMGQMLTVKSSNDNIKEILHNLFYDILNIEFNLWSWTRNLVKYGDFYLRLYISPEFGVYMVEPISSYNVTRVENSDLNNKNYIKFQVNLPEGGKIEELENYEVAHFRLLSDSNFLPYGKGIIEGARRVWKQVSLMEDAMLIHRVMRAPEKRIFKVDIGNIPPNEVDQYMERIINKTKKIPYIDEKTGDYNLRFNLQNMVEDFYLPVRGSDSGTSIEPLSGMEFTGIDDIEYLKNKMLAALKIPKAYLGFEEDLCIAPYTKIPLLNGTEKTVADLIIDYKNGIKNYVYSIDEHTKNIVPGEIEWAGYTRKNAEVVRVHLDNGEYIDCTPDHNFLTRDGKWIEAQYLENNQALMPLYRKKTTQKNKTGYEMVYHPSTQKYQEVHRLVAEYYNKTTKGSGKVVHHSDFNKLNNYPENLDCSMTWCEHRQYHSKLSYKTINSTENINQRISDLNWLSKVKIKFADKLRKYAKTHASVNKGNRSSKCASRHFFGQYKNHTVIRVEKLNIRIDTCDITVAKYHNFATSAGVIIHNSGKATLAQEDVRFARTIHRVQKFLISELTKIAALHLYAQGYRDAELVDFKLELTNPSTVFEKEKVSVWQEKTSLAKDMMDSKLYSKKWIYENIFKMSDDDIDVVANDLVEDAKQAYRIKQIEEEGIDPAKSYNKLTSGEEGGEGGGEGGTPPEEQPAAAGEKAPELKERDQTGRKKASDYPFGEDVMGTQEINRKPRTKTKRSQITHNYSKNSPLSLETLVQTPEQIKKQILTENKIKKSFLDESNIIE